MKYSYLICLLAMTLTSNVYAGSFDIKIGKISLPGEFVARPGTPATIRGTTIYSFIDNKQVRLSTINLGIILFNFKIKSPEIAGESGKKAAADCLDDTITAMKKSYPTRTLQKYSESKIGNHFAMEARIVSNIRDQKLFGEIRCMKYNDYLVTVTIIEKDKDASLGLLGSQVSGIELYK